MGIPIVRIVGESSLTFQLVSEIIESRRLVQNKNMEGDSMSSISEGLEIIQEEVQKTLDACTRYKAAGMEGAANVTYTNLITMLASASTFIENQAEQIERHRNHTCVYEEENRCLVCGKPGRR